MRLLAPGWRSATEGLGVGGQDVLQSDYGCGSAGTQEAVTILPRLFDVILDLQLGLSSYLSPNAPCATKKPPSCLLQKGRLMC